MAFGDDGVLLLAPPGGGKSDLALRLLGRGALLVADDQVEVTLEHGVLFAAPAAGLAGRIEVRGLGLLDGLPWRCAALRLVVRLVPADAVPRLPEPERWPVLGSSLPLLRLDGRAPSAPEVLGRALDALAGRIGLTAGAFVA